MKLFITAILSLFFLNCIKAEPIHSNEWTEQYVFVGEKLEKFHQKKWQSAWLKGKDSEAIFMEINIFLLFHVHTKT